MRRAWVQLVGEEATKGMAIACIGSTSARAAAKLGLERVKASGGGDGSVGPFDLLPLLGVLDRALRPGGGGPGAWLEAGVRMGRRRAPSRRCIAILPHVLPPYCLQYPDEPGVDTWAAIVEECLAEHAAAA